MVHNASKKSSEIAITKNCQDPSDNSTLENEKHIKIFDLEDMNDEELTDMWATVDSCCESFKYCRKTLVDNLSAKKCINKTLEKFTRKEIQESIYEMLGISADRVITTYRDKIDMSFTIEKLKNMDDDEFISYFDMGDNIEIGDSENTSSFKIANKKMKMIEEKARIDNLTLSK